MAVRAGIDLDEIQPWTDGKNLLTFIDGELPAPPILMEYAAKGLIAPLVGVRVGYFKFIYYPADPSQLFGLASDPDEVQNLMLNPANADKLAQSTTFMGARWDLERFDAEVKEEQARRHIVHVELRQRHY